MDRIAFLTFASEVTGYSCTELEGTGLVLDYWQLIRKQLGEELSAEFGAVALSISSAKSNDERVRVINNDVLSSPVWWPLTQAIIFLWYLGYWKSLDASWYATANSAVPEGVVPGSIFVPSAAAYIQQLAYRAAGAHPPGANPTGYASWSIPPVFGDILPSPEPTL